MENKITQEQALQEINMNLIEQYPEGFFNSIRFLINFFRYSYDDILDELTNE